MASVFFSYSHADEALRDQLEKQLALLKRNGIIETWHDRRIGPGQDFAKEIDKHVETDDIFLLLVSADFIASDYCFNHEMKRAMQRHEAGEAIVVPVILRACHWQGAPFGKLNAIPRDGKPVTSYADRDQALYEVAKAVDDAAARLSSMAMSTSQTLISHQDETNHSNTFSPHETVGASNRRSLRWLLSLPRVIATRDMASKPDIELDDIFQINEGLLRKHHIENIIFDVDQTLVVQGETELSDKIVAHVKYVSECLSGTVCFLTNEPHARRSEALRARTGFQVVSGTWKKPEPKAFANALHVLGVQPSKKVAMVGDRRWTDVLGANSAGLTSVLVNPRSPSKDAFGTSLVRMAEAHSAAAGKVAYFAFLAGMMLIITTLSVSILAFIYGSLLRSPTRYLQYLADYRYIWIAAFVIVSVLYLRILRTARARVVSFDRNPISGHFNTFPLALRYLASAVIIILVAFGWFGNDQLVQAGLTFCLFAILTLGFSLFPFYHTEAMRGFRILADIFLVISYGRGIERLLQIYRACLSCCSNRNFFAAPQPHVQYCRRSHIDGHLWVFYGHDRFGQARSSVDGVAAIGDDVHALSRYVHHDGNHNPVRI